MPTEEQKQELKDKVAALVRDKHEGSYAKAFAVYAEGNGAIGRYELMLCLKDAGVGNGLTRNRWVRGILTALDKDKDEKISLDEFLSIF